MIALCLACGVLGLGAMALIGWQRARRRRGEREYFRRMYGV